MMPFRVVQRGRTEGRGAGGRKPDGGLPRVGVALGVLAGLCGAMAPQAFAADRVAVVALRMDPALRLALVTARPAQPGSGPARQESNLPLSLADIVATLDAGTPRLRSGAKELEKAEAAQLGAYSAFLPEFDLSMQGVQIKNVAGSGSAVIGSVIVDARGRFYTNYAALSAQINLYAGGRTVAAYRAAKAGVEAARADLAYVRANEYLQLLRDFSEALKAEEAPAIARERLRLLSERLELTRSAFEGGHLSAGDVSHAEMEVIEARNELDRRETELARASLKLAQDLGLDISRQPGLAGELPLPPALGDYDPSTSVRQHPAVVAALERAKGALEQVKVARSAYLPKVSLVASYTWIGRSLDGMNEAIDATRANQYSVGVVLQQSFGPFVKETAALRQAQAAADIAQIRQDELQLQIANLVQESLKNLELAETEKLNAVRAEQEMLRILDLYRSQIRLGKGNRRDENALAAALASRRLERRQREIDLRLAGWTAMAALDPERFPDALGSRVAR